MRFSAPLQPATLLRRYKRFLADVRLADDTVVTAHCANPGSMLGLADPGNPVWVSRSADAKRKLPWSLELVEVDLGAGPALVGINTSYPNRLVGEALAAAAIPELCGYAATRREVRFGKNSRVDFLLQGGDRPDCYLEIKNVHLMRQPGHAEFPDSVTARGARHLAELADVAQRGFRAVMLYVVQRTDADRMGLAEDLDPVYAAAFAKSRAAGVETLVYGCDITRESIAMARPLPFIG